MKKQLIIWIILISIVFFSTFGIYGIGCLVASIQALKISADSIFEFYITGLITCVILVVVGAILIVLFAFLYEWADDISDNFT